jgi:hypothetical protein
MTPVEPDGTDDSGRQQDGADVTLVVPRPSTFTWLGITITTFTEDAWPGPDRRGDAVITTDLPDKRLLHAYNCGVLTIVENVPAD